MDFPDTPKFNIENESLRNNLVFLCEYLNYHANKEDESLSSYNGIGSDSDTVMVLKFTDKFKNYFEMDFYKNGLGIRRAIVKFNNKDKIEMCGCCLIEHYVRMCEDAIGEFIENNPELFIER